MRTGRSMLCLPQSQRKGNCDMQMSKLHVYLPSFTTQTFSEWSISLMFLILDPSFMSIPVRPGALILILLLWHHVPVTNWSPIQQPSFKSLIHSLCCPSLPFMGLSPPPPWVLFPSSSTQSYAHSPRHSSLFILGRTYFILWLPFGISGTKPSQFRLQPCISNCLLDISCG